MFESIFFLFLNYHCIHHLFPLVDISHHRDIQIILMQCCKEHHVEYEVKDFFVLYGEMIVCFSRPQSLDMNIKHYHSVS